MLSTAPYDLKHCMKLAPCTPVIGGAVYRFAGNWTPDAVTRFLEEAFGKIQHSNRIDLHAEGLWSNQPVALSLHQEDYHLPIRPRLLALLCLENIVAGGETIVSSLNPVSIPEGLEDQQIRFYRRSVGEWTPWRPILEDNGGQLWPRIALPDVHRVVEVSSCHAVFAAWIARLEADAKSVTWKAGTLLIIDNRISIHGRKPMSGAVRSLMRWVL